MMGPGSRSEAVHHCIDMPSLNTLETAGHLGPRVSALPLMQWQVTLLVFVMFCFFDIIA